MANKSNQRARALAASTGVSFQAAKNELGRAASAEKKYIEFAFGQIEEAVKLLPPRLPDEGTRIPTEVYSLSLVDVKGSDGAIPMAPVDRILWDVRRESFQTTVTIELDPLPEGVTGESDEQLTIGLSILLGGRVKVQEYDTNRHVGRFTINIGRVRHRGDPSKVHVLHSFVWPTNPFVKFSVPCPDCKRWILCREEDDGVCYCGAEFTIRFDAREDWTMKQEGACMDCGCPDGFSEPKEGRNPWRWHSSHQQQCNRCHTLARTAGAPTPS